MMFLCIMRISMFLCIMELINNAIFVYSLGYNFRNSGYFEQIDSCSLDYLKKLNVKILKNVIILDIA